MEQDASAYYEAAINRGLDAERHGRTLVQWASTLRNLGQLDRAIDLLSQADAASLGGAPKAFLALALSDAGREKEALRAALEALVPHLPRYQRSLTAYARALTDPQL